MHRGYLGAVGIDAKNARMGQIVAENLLLMNIMDG